MVSFLNEGLYMSRSRLYWPCVAVCVCSVSLVPNDHACAQTETNPAASDSQPDPELVNGPETWRAAALESRKPNPEYDRISKLYKWVGVYRDVGDLLFEKRDFAAVEKAMKEQLEKISDPLAAEQYATTVYWLGHFPYKHEPEEMRTLARAWTDSHPDSHFAWLVRGRQAISYAWYWRGNGFANTVTQEGWEHFESALNEARTYLNRSYELEPKDPESSAALVEMCVGGDCAREEFARYVDRVCALVPSHTRVHDQVLRSLLPKWGGSWELVDEFLEILDGKIAEQGHPMLGLVKLSAYRSMTSEREGYADFQRKPEIMAEVLSMRKALVKRWPDDPATRAELARAYVIRQQFADASKEFEIIGDRFPSEGPYGLVAYHQARISSLFRGAALATTGSVDELFDRIIAIDPENAGSYQQIGFTKSQFGAYDEAEAAFKRSLELDPENGTTYRMLGTVYEKTERYEEALECVAKAKEYDPSEEGLTRTGRLEARILDRLGQDFKPLATPSSP